MVLEALLEVGTKNAPYVATFKAQSRRPIEFGGDSKAESLRSGVDGRNTFAAACQRFFGVRSVLAR